MKTIKFCKWLLSIMEEDNGKASIKRWLVLGLFLLVAFANIYTRLHYEVIDMMSIEYCKFITDTCFMLIAVLLGLTYLPTRSNAPTVNPDKPYPPIKTVD